MRMHKTVNMADAYLIHYQKENTDRFLVNTKLQEHFCRENFSFHLKAREHNKVQMSFVLLYLNKCEDKYIFTIQTIVRPSV